MIKASFVQPFRTGDVVQYIGYASHWKGEHIIEETSLSCLPFFEYATTKGAWIAHEEFELIRECDEASIQQLMSEQELT